MPLMLWAGRNRLRRLDGGLIVELARRMVLAAAPGEQATFHVTSEAFIARGGRLPRPPRTVPEVDWGPAEVVLLVTPLALIAATKIVEHLVGTRLVPPLDRGIDASRDGLRRLFRFGDGSTAPSADDPGPAAQDPATQDPATRDPATQDPATQTVTPRLTHDEWRFVYQLVIDAARDAGLDEQRARLMAGSVVGHGELGGEL